MTFHRYLPISICLEPRNRFAEPYQFKSNQIVTKDAQMITKIHLLNSLNVCVERTVDFGTKYEVFRRVFPDSSKNVYFRLEFPRATGRIQIGFQSAPPRCAALIGPHRIGGADAARCSSHQPILGGFSKSAHCFGGKPASASGIFHWV